MSKPPKTKKLGVKALLELMGADPNEVVPSTLWEARDLAGVGRTEHPKCPTTGKTSFSSESVARQAATARLNKGANTGKLRSYRCEHCNAFHLSSSFHR